ncbi:MAG: anthranilate synthase component II [Actinomycetota bacterium]
MTVRLLLVDNFDSFVYNLAQAFGSLETEPIVVRSDATMADLKALEPDGVVISPGPGDPSDAGVSVDAIRSFSHEVPILGVCLGHQCIGAAFGGSIARAAVGPVHGKTSQITHEGAGVFRGLPSPFTATRYHSLAVLEEPWPDDLGITARSEDGIVMGVRHESLPVEGVQFHPESVLTERGPQLLLNFVDDVRASSRR